MSLWPSSPYNPLVVPPRRLSIEGHVEDGEGFGDAVGLYSRDGFLLLLQQGMSDESAI